MCGGTRLSPEDAADHRPMLRIVRVPYSKSDVVGAGAEGAQEEETCWVRGS